MYVKSVPEQYLSDCTVLKRQQICAILHFKSVYAGGEAMTEQKKKVFIASAAVLLAAALPADLFIPTAATLTYLPLLSVHLPKLPTRISMSGLRLKARTLSPKK